MDKKLKLQVLYKATNSWINLLNFHHNLFYRLEFIENNKLLRLSNNSICLNQKKSNKRLLIINGTDNPPDIWNLTKQDILEVRGGMRFISNLDIDNLGQNLIQHEKYISYTLSLEMITQNFVINFNQSNGKIKWQWTLEEV